MITALAPLGARYKLQLVPEYDGDQVTVSVIYSLKGEKESVIKSLTFSGTPVEVEAALAADLPKAVEKLVAHVSTLDELDRELAAEVEKKKDEVKAKTAAPTPAPSAAKSAPVKKPASATATPSEAVKKDAPKLEAETPPPPPGALTPAWKKLAGAPASTPEQTPSPVPEEDIDSLFEGLAVTPESV